MSTQASIATWTGDYERTNLNALVLLVYDRPGDKPTAPNEPLNLFRYVVAPH